MWEIIFAEPNFYNHLLQSGVPADFIIRFAFDSADDLHLTGESLIDLQERNNKVNPEKFMTLSVRASLMRESITCFLTRCSF